MVEVPEDCEEIECGAGLGSVDVFASEEGMDTSCVFTRGELEVVVIKMVNSGNTKTVGAEDILIAGLGCPSVVE